MGSQQIFLSYYTGRTVKAFNTCCWRGFGREAGLRPGVTLSPVLVGRTLCSSRSTLKMHLRPLCWQLRSTHSLSFKEGGQDTHRRAFTAPLLVKARTPQAMEVSPQHREVSRGCRSTCFPGMWAPSPSLQHGRETDTERLGRCPRSPSR